jgi:hypothetical protein
MIYIRMQADVLSGALLHLFRGRGKYLHLARERPIPNEGKLTGKIKVRN